MMLKQWILLLSIGICLSTLMHGPQAGQSEGDKNEVSEPEEKEEIETSGPARRGKAALKIATKPALLKKYLNEAKEHFTFKGKPIHPAIIRQFENLPGDNNEPYKIAIDLNMAFDTNAYNDYSEPVEVFKDGDKNVVRSKHWGNNITDYYEYTRIGPLKNGLYILMSTHNKGGKITKKLHVVNFSQEQVRKPQPILRDKAVKKKGYDDLRSYSRLIIKSFLQMPLHAKTSAKDISIDGNTVTVNGNKHIIEKQIDLNNVAHKPPSPGKKLSDPEKRARAALKIARDPVQLRKYLKEAREHFTFQGKPIHPRILEYFEVFMSDWNEFFNEPYNVEVDLNMAFNTKKYPNSEFEEYSTSLKDKDTVGFVDGPDADSHSYYEYTKIGPLKNGMHVVLCRCYGGGSFPPFHTLQILDFSLETALASDLKPYTRLMMKSFHPHLFAVNPEDISIQGNTIIISGKKIDDKGETIHLPSHRYLIQR